MAPTDLARMQAVIDRLAAEIEAQHQRFNTAINNMSQGLCFFDGAQRLIVCNDLYAQMYKLTRELVRPGTTLREIVDHRFAARCQPKMTREEYLKWRDVIAVSPVASDTEVELEDGRIIAIHHQPMPDGGWVATHEDITERRRAEEALRAAKQQLEMIALQDPLTGLANRRKFAERFEYVASLARRSKSETSLLVVDIDHFKSVNDRLGHAAGDACLVSIASLLLASAREVDLVARFGGEEFVLLLPDTGTTGALRAAERIRAHVAAHPCRIEGTDSPEPITVSIGVATSKAGSVAFDELFAHSDRALYRAKRAGRNRVSQ
jgi:diguanylate cyclase (GGDEF)-like protein